MFKNEFVLLSFFDKFINYFKLLMKFFYVMKYLYLKQQWNFLIDLCYYSLNEFFIFIANIIVWREFALINIENYIEVTSVHSIEQEINSNQEQNEKIHLLVTIYYTILHPIFVYVICSQHFFFIHPMKMQLINELLNYVIHVNNE